MTTDAATEGQLGRRVAAVSAGFVAIFVLSLGTDVLLHAAGVYPRWGRPMAEGLFVLATAYRLVYDVFGGWLAARLAPDRPIAHAMALGALGLLIALGGVAASLHAPELGPRWYPLLLAGLALPSAWIGGRLRERQAARAAAGAR